MQENGQHGNVEEDDETGEAEAEVEEGLGAVVADVEEEAADYYAQEYAQRDL